MKIPKISFKKLLIWAHQSFLGFLRLPPQYVGNHGCIRTAASHIAYNQIEGDYFEFGVYQGSSFVAAYHEIMRKRREHGQLGYDSPEYNQWKANMPRFFAFDSFEGLPEGGDEKRMVDYDPGAYSCTEADFVNYVTYRGVNLADVVRIKGFYDQTCQSETKKKHNIKAAAVVLIDCDLYISTVPVMDFLTDIVQQGTILIFHDWFRFKGNPNEGEQRACGEWLGRNPQLELIEFWKEGPQAVAFLVNFRSNLGR